MTLDTTIQFFRRRRMQQFRAECRIERSAGAGTFNPSTGTVTDLAPTIVYEGVCNVRESQWQGTDIGVVGGIASGGRSVEELRFNRAEMLFPHDTAVEKDDVVIVTAATHDADLVGQRYRVTDIFLDAWQITRRAMGEKVT